MVGLSTSDVYSEIFDELIPDRGQKSPREYEGNTNADKIRDDILRGLPDVLEKHGMFLSASWAAMLAAAEATDRKNFGKSSLRNTITATEFAIEDAVDRKRGGPGIPANITLSNLYEYDPIVDDVIEPKPVGRQSPRRWSLQRLLDSVSPRK